MKSSSHFKKRVILISLFLLIQNTVFSQEVKLANLKIANTRDDLLVYVNMQGAFQDKIKNSVLSGVQAKFSFFITLYQVRDMWIDKKIEELKINHMIKYNTLKKEFTIRRSWEKEKLQITKSFIEAQQLMSNIDHLKVVSLSRLEKDRKYQIKVKAVIIIDTQPISLHYASCFATKWYTIDFIY